MAACIHSSCGNETASSPFSQELSDNQCKIRNSLCRFATRCKPSFQNFVSCNPIKRIHLQADEEDVLWLKIREEALRDTEQEPILSKYYCSSILLHDSLECALSYQLAAKLSNTDLPSSTIMDVFGGVLEEDEEIRRAIRADLKAVKERDPACISYVHCFLNFKGFLACQAQRVAHKLWSQGRIVMALLIQSRVSEVFTVDIHPGAKLGHGVVLDHATGIVIGETTVIGDNVTILHNVTLGGTGKVNGDRHPKVGNGVLIGAGTKVLGSIRVGDKAKIGAGSVVLKEVPPESTSVGNPARLVGPKS